MRTHNFNMISDSSELDFEFDHITPLDEESNRLWITLNNDEVVWSLDLEEAKELRGFLDTFINSRTGA